MRVESISFIGFPIVIERLKENEDQERALVVKLAKEWLKTPWQHKQMCKGAGVDCAMYPLAVYREAGLIGEIDVPYYPADWHLHKSEELYLGVVERWSHEIFILPKPGDFVLYKYGRAYSHGAIVIAWPLIIHSVMGIGVTLSDGEKEGCIVGRDRRYFTLW